MVTHGEGFVRGMLIQARNVNRRNELDDEGSRRGRRIEEEGIRASDSERKKGKGTRERPRAGETRELVCGGGAAWLHGGPTSNFGISSNNREDRRNSGYSRHMYVHSRAEPHSRP